MVFRIRGRDGDSLVRVGPLEATRDFPPEGPPGLLVTEPELLRLQAARLPSLPLVLVPRGEAAKTPESLTALWGAFLEAGLDRASRVVAAGGGAVSDLAGFAASTWLRGIGFEYLPTTLLAMVDAAVGGKTAIDFRGRKNLVGSFCQPRRVLCEVGFLDSLPDADFASGMAEAIKHGIIAGGDYLALLEGLGGRRPREAEGGRELLEALVAGSIACKAGIVDRDEREEGERRLLNLGHSYGHALETVLGLAHGEAVAAGIGAAARLAELRGGTEPGFLTRITSLLRAWGLPSSFAEAFALAAGRGEPRPEVELRAAVAAALAADKKREGAFLRFVLPRGPGRLEILPLPLGELETFALETP